MNKTIFSLSIFAFFLSVCAEKTNAQASGAKPELFMYRHNGSIGGSPAPAATGNTLGTIQWRGLTAVGSVLEGATIRSVATHVSPGVMSANMFFSTRSAAGLTDKVIITPEGLVGIGEMNPVFHLDVLGNTHTSGRFWGRIHYDLDLGNANDVPNDYIDESYFERKNRLALGLAANAFADGGTLSLAPGGNSLDRQIYTGGNDGLWTRSQELTGLNSWAAWEKILTSGDINGRPHMVARFTPPGPESSRLRDGQIFDNTTNVVIGGFLPAPAVPAPVFDVLDVLTVTGRARVDGNTHINGNTGMGTAPTANRLEVSGTSHFDGGNMGLGTAPTANRLELSGNSRFAGNATVAVGVPGTGNLTVENALQVNGNGRVNGMLVVGNPPSVPIVPVQHELYVNGSIIAEEVVVKLQGNWPDYVMEENYKLKPLSEVEAFVQKEKHLPGVPSAVEVAENGISLGEMQKTQMEKIEELYLHMIAMEKRMNALEAENTALKAELKSSKQ